MTLCLICPHCNTVHEDVLELFDANVTRAMRCSECAETFWFRLLDCGHCAEEQVLTWLKQPQDQSETPYECKSCGHSFIDRATAETDHEWPAS